MGLRGEGRADLDDPACEGGVAEVADDEGYYGTGGYHDKDLSHDSVQCHWGQRTNMSNRGYADTYAKQVMNTISCETCQFICSWLFLNEFNGPTISSLG
jgi:hypothetical protein